MLAGVPQRGNTLGSASAPVTVVEYVDLQCPFCRQFKLEAFPKLVSRFVRTGKAKIEARPIAFIGPDSVTGQAGVIAAGEQDRMFNFLELLYFNQGAENSGWLDDALIKAAAASIPGLDSSTLQDALDSSSVKARAQTFERLAQADSLRATPTILVGKTGQELRQVELASPSDEHSVAAAIESSLH